MKKKCVIYYGTVVEDLTDQAQLLKGHIAVEPIAVNSEKSIGKAPDLCCESFMAAMREYHMVFRFEPGVQVEMRFRHETIYFCPFCGAEIVLKKHLNLRVLKKILTIPFHYYEEVTK